MAPQQNAAKAQAQARPIKLSTSPVRIASGMKEAEASRGFHFDPRYDASRAALSGLGIWAEIVQKRAPALNICCASENRRRVCRQFDVLARPILESGRGVGERTRRREL
jgi:hypothetical protein